MSGSAGKADSRNGQWSYERRRPEQTLLYRLVAEHYPRFLQLLADQGRSLPDYVQREFQDFLKCGILEHGFLRVRCQDCNSERLVAFSCKRRGFWMGYISSTTSPRCFAVSQHRAPKRWNS